MFGLSALTCRKRATLSPITFSRFHLKRMANPRSNSISFSNATSVPGSRHTGTFGSPTAANPRVIELLNCVVTSLSPTFAGPPLKHQNNRATLRRTPMKFRPLHDRVAVKRIEAEEKPGGGIIIPDTAKEKPQQGEVVAVGPGGRDETGKLIPIDVQAGDRVLFGKWSGTEVKIDGDEYLI